MKILNKIIEESELFGKHLFGDLFDKGEADTEIENDVEETLQKFFSMTGEFISKKEFGRLKLLFNRVNDYDDIKNSSNVYRYTYHKPYFTTNLNINIGETINSLKDKEIYLGSFKYKPTSPIQSWTTKPDSNVIQKYFNAAMYGKNGGNVLLKSNSDNTVLTADFTNDFKDLMPIYDDELNRDEMVEEYEVLKLSKDVIDVDVMYIPNTLISTNMILGFFQKCFDDKNDMEMFSNEISHLVSTKIWGDKELNIFKKLLIDIGNKK